MPVCQPQPVGSSEEVVPSRLCPHIDMNMDAARGTEFAGFRLGSDDCFQYPGRRDEMPSVTGQTMMRVCCVGFSHALDEIALGCCLPRSAHNA